MFTTDHEWSTIANALRYAADKYLENAKELREIGPQYESLAEQFDRQTKEVLDLAERIEREQGV